MNLKFFEKECLDVEEITIDPTHMFSDGMYFRTIEIPAGTVIEGKRHRNKTMNILLKGKMTIYDGEEAHEITAPFMVESEPNTKKLGYAHEDSVWLNVHRTDSTDLNEIEKQVTITEEEYNNVLPLFKGNLCHG
jgi:hypothetical protein